MLAFSLRVSRLSSLFASSTTMLSLSEDESMKVSSWGARFVLLTLDCAVTAKVGVEVGNSEAD